MLNYGKKYSSFIRYRSASSFFISFNIVWNVFISNQISCGMYRIKINITGFFIFLKSLSREINYKDSVKYNKTITTIGQTIYCYCFILTFVNWLKAVNDTSNILFLLRINCELSVLESVKCVEIYNNRFIIL